MADFITAFKITSQIEGGYSNDPADYGKETYRGISRKFFPNWEGWAIVDNYKSVPDFPNNMSVDKALDSLVLAFYKKEFWDVNKLDNISSQIIAEEIYDTGVNLGVKKAALFLQIALNVLNKRGNAYPNVEEDSSIGNNTLKALEACLKYKGEAPIFKVMNILQGAHYITRAREDESQEKFMYGWLERVTFSKKQ